MQEQLSLTGIEPAPQLNDRLFLAILPDAIAAASIERQAQQWRTEHGLAGKPLDTSRFHVTLFHIDDYVTLPPGVVDAVRKASATLTMPSVDIAFDRVGSFSRKSGKAPFVLRGGEGTTALMSFQQALGNALMKAGVKHRSGTTFTPHVTLLYDDHEVPTHPVEPICWTSREFVLIHSLLRKTQHLLLGRWPLI